MFMQRGITIVFFFLTWTASAQESCPTPLDADQDGLIGVNDMLNLLGVFGDTDMDFDGVWDSVDECIGSYDDCGICNGPGAIYDCGCYGALIDGSCCGGPVEFEGYSYQTVQIGNQCWFAEDLKFNPLNSSWGSTSFYESQTYALPENLLDGTPQGARYNFIAVEELELCPETWRVPSSQDIDNFEAFLETAYPGEESFAIRNDSAWSQGTNVTGFNAFPMPDYPSQGEAYWWTTTSWSGYPDAEGFYMVDYSSNLARSVQFSRSLKFAVRCMRD